MKWKLRRITMDGKMHVGAVLEDSDSDGVPVRASRSETTLFFYREPPSKNTDTAFAEVLIRDLRTYE